MGLRWLLVVVVHVDVQRDSMQAIIYSVENITINSLLVVKKKIRFER